MAPPTGSPSLPSAGSRHMQRRRSVFCGAGLSVDTGSEAELHELTQFFRQKLAIKCTALCTPGSFHANACPQDLPAALASPEDSDRLLRLMQALLSRSLEAPAVLSLPVTREENKGSGHSTAAPFCHAGLSPSALHVLRADAPGAN
ncbi:Armadillo/beta-catenin family repeat-containing protein [Besnoitia besnoiti]|uniref:Armadillo/beta-catenin family repeat-containing protein n=1 Tax=Besnoitia besnoiti TaxID=94643 RepID=A0A2A9MIW3_BESBE|nr:Armadillo/beta-catenin family repeat-containing protein [Besnoitia besnoiti]PFH37134.1 Armadillo/beta-catenin family repeat-containing protein [Besnoitia besnoiti]